MFISFEGGDGSRKTTQAAAVERRLREAGVPVLLVQEPGSTGLGMHLRDWLKRDMSTVPMAELLLFEAARAQLVAEVVRPALAAGRTVIADRFIDSTLAYQGYGRGLDLSLIRTLNDAATGGLTPDLTVLLDVEAGDAIGRVAARAADSGRRKFEDLPIDFHQRVVAGFKELAALGDQRWLVLNGARSESAIADDVWAAVTARLRTGARGQRPGG